MLPRALSCTPPEVISFFYWTKKVVEQLPEDFLGANENGEQTLVSCHLLAKGIERALPELPFRVTSGTGYFNQKGHEHSWLEINENPFFRFIIDLLPLAAVGGPILIHASSGAVGEWAKLYQEDNRPPWTGLSPEKFNECAEKIAAFARQIPFP